MAKVFLSFMNCMGRDASVAMPCYYESFVRGMQKAGNDLMVFCDYGPFQGHSSAIKFIKKKISCFQPDLVIAFNNYGPDFAAMCDCPILILEVDSPLYYGGKDRIKKMPDRYSYCIVQEDSRHMLMRQFGVPDSLISFMPFFLR